MPVVHPTILPQGQNLRAPGFLSEAYTGFKPYQDLLLQAFLSGQLGQQPTAPTPGRPGTLQFPSGAMTPTSPQELAQIQAMGGVPSQQGMIAPMGQPSAGGIQYTLPTRFGFSPNLERQKTQAEIEKLQGDIAFQKQLPEIYKGLYGQGGGQTEKIRQVEDDALAGDEEAVVAYRYLKRIGAL